MEPLLLTVDELAEKLKVSRTLLYHLREKDGLPWVPLGSTVRFNLEEVKAWLASHSIKEFKHHE